VAEAPGTKLGHYRLVAPIGTGGFATVYRAVDERLDAEVAIKVLAENHALDVAVRERFITEAQLLRRVCDPAVVTVYDIGETDRAQPFIVLAFADRGDLRTRVRQYRDSGRRPAGDDLLQVARTLAAALGRAHAIGLVHRDVTPDNLLISSTGGPGGSGPGLLAAGERLQLGDLGLAKDLAASSGFSQGVGTQGFSAPEQRSGLSRVDARADVFGASAVLFWLATGAVPPDGEQARARALAGAGVPDAVTGAVRRGLATDPADRFATIEQWHRGMTDASTSTARQPPAAADGDQRLGAPRSIVPGWLPVAAVVVGAALASLAWWGIGRQSAPTVTALGNGQVKVERQVGELRGAVFGPTVAAVGQQLTFQAAVTGAASFRWVAPDGQLHDGNPLVTTAVRAGAGRVTLLVSDANGTTTTVEFPFMVTV
jgi:eukaryotic-like serine/threonine-protein kinase